MNATHGAHLDEVYPLLPFTPVRGRGVYLIDADGREILDLYGGHAVAALGYGHPRLVAAISRQAEEMSFQSNAVKLPVRDRAADKLAAFADCGVPRVFFVNSGAEANENALKLACKLTGRERIVAMEHGFHGRTAAAAAASFGSSKGWYGFPRTPFAVDFVPRDDIAGLEQRVGADTAAVILEPVQGLAGAYDFSTEFVRAARAVCDRSGAMLILDEVQSGMGRLGEPFGANLHGVRPDILTTAKGLGGGFPAGAVLMSTEIAAELKAGELGTTFGGGPMACAAIEAVIDTIADEELLARVRVVSAEIRETVRGGLVTGIRGRGFLLGLTVVPRAAAVRDALLTRGILTGTSNDPHVLRLLPSLILESAHVALLAQTLGELEHASL